MKWKAGGATFIAFAIYASGALAQQTELNICEQSIGYSLTAPSPQVPENVRAFSGLWTGLWDGILCSAVIVESVEADGTTSLIYAVGSARGGRPGSSPRTAKIVGKSLTFATVSNNPITLLMTGPNRLSGTYRNSNGQVSGFFDRRAP